MEYGGGGGGGWVRGRCLGRGSTAAVHLASSPTGAGEGRSFAVKSAEAARAAPLRKECEILSSLCNPHVVSCFGSGVTAEADGRVLYNLFLEYVPGGSLAELAKRRGGLDERTISGYTRGILSGLSYLHSAGIVHCDLKGHNVLVVGAGDEEDDGGVKLADFGCARRDSACGHQPGVVAGTPLFMAPEVARGEDQGPEADMWALGCTVIEMATGRPPWPDVADPIAAIHRIAFSADAPELPGHLSDGARDFLGKCLDRDPRKRLSAAELLDHPFVRCGKASLSSASISYHAKRKNSPKSTLDQDLWESWGSEDEEPEHHSAESIAERLRRRLGGVGVSPTQAAEETWEEENSWVTVRNGVAVSPSDDRSSTIPSCSEETAGGAIGGAAGGAVGSPPFDFDGVDPVLSFTAPLVAGGDDLDDDHHHFNEHGDPSGAYDYSLSICRQGVHLHRPLWRPERVSNGGRWPAVLRVVWLIADASPSSTPGIRPPPRPTKSTSVKTVERDNRRSSVAQINEPEFIRINKTSLSNSPIRSSCLPAGRTPYIELNG
ncbi:unnamed protein product [Spirodela intermedia]|uniref:Protein kinase domain-containing protein n=1 Tax=Spirodela intermedia TaxID=51605 RepID=A0A7I8LEE7_SPIIN|nr:unnamed protein product [Spirodela intermedia]